MALHLPPLTYGCRTAVVVMCATRYNNIMFNWLLDGFWYYSSTTGMSYLLMSRECFFHSPWEENHVCAASPRIA